MGVSLMTSALFFPLLVWGGFVFLPFDAPLLDGAPLRLVYTLRCSVFAATPIILGESPTTEETRSLPVSPAFLTCVSHLRVSPVPQAGWFWASVGFGPVCFGLCLMMR